MYFIHNMIYFIIYHGFVKYQPPCRKRFLQLS